MEGEQKNNNKSSLCDQKYELQIAGEFKEQLFNENLKL